MGDLPSEVSNRIDELMEDANEIEQLFIELIHDRNLEQLFILLFIGNY